MQAGLDPGTMPVRWAGGGRWGGGLSPASRFSCKHSVLSAVGGGGLWPPVLQLDLSHFWEQWGTATPEVLKRPACSVANDPCAASLGQFPFSGVIYGQSIAGCEFPIAVQDTLSIGKTHHPFFDSFSTLSMCHEMKRVENGCSRVSPAPLPLCPLACLAPHRGSWGHLSPPRPAS